MRWSRQCIELTGGYSRNWSSAEDNGPACFTWEETARKTLVSYRSRSSSWIFASVLASRYFTMTGV